MWYSTCDILHVIFYMWYSTCDINKRAYIGHTCHILHAEIGLNVQWASGDHCTSSLTFASKHVKTDANLINNMWIIRDILHVVHMLQWYATISYMLISQCWYPQCVLLSTENLTDNHTCEILACDYIPYMPYCNPMSPELTTVFPKAFASLQELRCVWLCFLNHDFLEDFLLYNTKDLRRCMVELWSCSG